MPRNALDAAASVSLRLHEQTQLDPRISSAMGVERLRRGRRREMFDPSVRRQVQSNLNTVYKAVRFLGNWVAALDRGVTRVSFEKDETGRENQVREFMREHRLSQILGKGSFAQPNPWTTAANYLANLTWDLGLTGNHYALKVRNPAEGNRVWWLIRLRPDWIKVIADEQNVGIAGYVLRPTGTTIGEIGGSFGDLTIVFDKKEIVHVRGPNSTDDRIGYSPLRALAASVSSDKEIREYNATFFQQGARIDGIVQGVNTQVQVDEVYELLNSSHYQGTDTAWLPLVLPSGLQFTPTEQSFKDMEWSTLAQQTKQDILEAYGVPMGLLGTVTDVNRANLAGLQVIAAQNGVRPVTTSIEEALEADCLNTIEEPQQSPDDYFEYDFEEATPADPEQELARRESDLKHGVVTINEVRTEDDRGPVDWGESPWLPLSMVQVGDAAAEAAAEADDDDDEVEDADVVIEDEDEDADADEETDDDDG